eukprot:7008696-Pyramimonas_sp.AAC.1
MRLGLRSAAYHAWARRQATNLAPGRKASHGIPSTPGAPPLGVRTVAASCAQQGAGRLDMSVPGCPKKY